MLPSEAEAVLRAAIQTRRQLRGRTRAAGALAIGLAGWLAIDAAILLEWITDRAAAHAAWWNALLFALLGSALAALSAWLPRETRERAARRIDGAQPALGESVEALVSLERRREEPFVPSYAARIGRRAAAVLRRDGVPYPYSRERRGLRIALAICAAVVLALVGIEQRADPWGALQARAMETAEVGDKLEAPDSAAPEVALDWGEVRITEPGRDLRVTKVDVVPLEIEAATSGELVGARWFTAKSGEPDVAHALPAPEDPHHALFAPHLYVDELRLSDWDVVAYHAGASTAGGRELASRIYFLEIRPFREEILQLGEGGAGRRTAFALLGEISGLIDRQKHVVRETHHHLRQPRRDAGAQRDDREKLRRAEEEVLEASDHLYGRVAAEMENQPVAEVLDHLALAQGELAEAVAALGEAEGEPLVPEQEALRHLVASRKAFHKAIGGGEGEGGDPDAGEPSGPIAGLEDQLREMTELRNERAAVRDEVRELLDAQRALAERVEKAPSGERRSHAEPQRKLLEELTGLAELHPRPFAHSREELRAALGALQAARDELGAAKDPAASQREAVAGLEALHASLAAEARRGERADGYALQKALAQARARLAEIERDPASVGDAELRELGERARSAARGLDGGLPGGLPGLPGLEGALASLEAAADDAARSRAAGAARRALEEIEADLGRRTPELVRRLRERNPLEESPDDGLDDALRQLRALADEHEERERSPEEREAARRDIVGGLAPGLRRLYGETEARSILALVEDGLAGEGFDPARLRDLVSRIESRRVEIRESEEREADEQTLVRKDPTRLAPAYRRRVEEYFRRLSER